MNDLGAYISSIIGRPWGAAREDNCWALVSDLQLRFFQRRLPLVDAARLPRSRHRAIHEHPLRSSWGRVREPEHGAVVLMSRDRLPRIDEHAGVCLMMPAPLIVHVENPQGVCADDLLQLEMKGWRPDFYTPA